MVRLKAGRVKIDLKGVETLADINESLSQIIKAAAQGELSIDEAKGLQSLIEAKRRRFKLVELETRVTGLEAKTS